MTKNTTSSIISETLNALTNTLSQLMFKFTAPGGQLAVLIGDELHQHNIGWAINQTVPVRSDSLFRVASNSKPLTAITIMWLYERGLLHLDDHPYCTPAFFGCGKYCKSPGILAQTLSLPNGTSISIEQCSATIYDLLVMAGGFCEQGGIPNTPCASLPVAPNMGFLPSYEALIAYQQNISSPLTPPATTAQLIGLLATKIPQFPPGSSYDYENSAYAALGKIISGVTNQTYESVVLSLLATHNITTPRIASDFLSGRLPKEVVYYPQPSTPVPSIYPPISTPENPHLVNPAYGGTECLPAQAACGGWVMSATTMAEINYAMGEPPSFFHPGRAGILKPKTIQKMLERPNMSVWKESSNWFGMGFNVNEMNGTYRISKNGLIPGTFSQLANSGRTIKNDPPIIMAFVTNSDFNYCNNCYPYVQNLFNLAIESIRYNTTFDPPPLPNSTNSNNTYYGGAETFSHRDSFAKVEHSHQTVFDQTLTTREQQTNTLNETLKHVFPMSINNLAKVPAGLLSIGAFFANKHSTENTQQNSYRFTTRARSFEMPNLLLLICLSSLSACIVISLLILIMRRASPCQNRFFKPAEVQRNISGTSPYARDSKNAYRNVSGNPRSIMLPI